MRTTVAKTTRAAVAPARWRITILLWLRAVVRRVTAGYPRRAKGWMPAPLGAPCTDMRRTVVAAEQFRRGLPVWAYIAKAWLPATIAEIDGSSVLVTYRIPGREEMSLETVHNLHLAPRAAHPTIQDGVGQRKRAQRHGTPASTPHSRTPAHMS
ncbi:hypothetical protein Cci01nite_71800 [Catellatospora citrea]|uniref:Uncharacterized protein n=1 Tax=Catellatospora citrea TaxID=53366 RepID=A0A8J3P394_9ACTN|nr:hypothetical protein C8E86_2742 [Catellatospora citrea]GIG02087.1 hypothetical protein Cci01nite_71800 [Catellatospora citrea]